MSKAGRYYGQVATSIWHSKRFNKLDGPLSRLAYLHLHTCQFTNLVGLFRFNEHHFAAEMVDVENADHGEMILADLAQVGLISRQDDFIQITKWFQAIPPYNPSVVVSGLRILNDRSTPRGDLRDRALWDLIFAAYVQAQNWKPDSAPRNEMEKALEQTVRTELERRSDRVEKTLTFLELEKEDTAWSMLWQAYG